MMQPETSSNKPLSARTDNVHGGQALNYAQRKRIPLEQVLDFSANINPITPQIDWQQFAKDAAPQIVHYPTEFDAGSDSRLKPLLSENFQVAEEHITLCNGISQAIWQLFAAIQPKQTLLFTPIYNEYQKAASAHSRTVQHLQVLSDTEVGADSVIVLVNPTTPQGIFQKEEAIWELLQQAKRFTTWLIIDESFLPFINLDISCSARQWLSDYPKLIVLQSLTKFYACPGIRIGAVFCSHPKIQTMLPQVWSLSTLDRLWLEQALQDKNHLEKTQQWLQNAKSKLQQELKSLPIVNHILPSDSSYLCVMFDRKVCFIQEHLDQSHILIRDTSSFGLDAKIARIAIKSHSENQKLLSALQQLSPLKSGTEC